MEKEEGQEEGQERVGYLISKSSQIDQENLEHWKPHAVEILEQSHEGLDNSQLANKQVKSSQDKSSQVKSSRDKSRQSDRLAHIYCCLLMGVCLRQVPVALS